MIRRLENNIRNIFLVLFLFIFLYFCNFSLLLKRVAVVYKEATIIRYYQVLQT